MLVHGFCNFSSRRRHTRWNCDWSSDVCSSDLRRVATGRTSVPRLGFRQAGELAKLADGVAREQFIDKLLVGLAVVEVLAALPAERQHELAHARVGAVLLIIFAEVADQAPGFVVELDAV